MPCSRMVSLITALVGSALSARADYDPYQPLADWNSLPSPKVVSAGMASSYDRTGGNNDYNNYESLAVYPRLVTELDGPGVLTRFWMPHLAAAGNTNIRVIIDGTVVIGNTSSAILGGTDGSGPTLRSPFVQTLVGGQVSYEPIAFQHSLKIDNDPVGADFHQWGYHRLPAGTTVASYTGTLTAAQQASRNAAANVLNSAGSNPAGADPLATRTTPASLNIPAGGTVSLANLTGAGTVREINLNMGASISDSQLDGLRLRVRYGNEAGYAIDVPVSHFFGVGHGRAAYKSLPLGVNNDGSYYSYWPMPYDAGVTIELHNTTGSSIATGNSSVEYKTGAVANAGKLHAVHREEVTTAGQTHFELLNITGSGHYVGNMLYARTQNSNQLEGDDLIIVDGDVANAIRGTGLEDAYNGGYYYNRLTGYQIDETGTPDTAALHGLLQFNNFVSTDQYRWLIPDSVPFTDSLQVKMENWQSLAGNTFGSTAFYYSTVPEPLAGGLLMCGAAIALLRRWRRQTC